MWRALPTSAVCCLLACGDGPSTPQDDAATASSAGFETTTISLTGTTREFTFLPNSDKILGGVRVCQDEPRRCTQASSRGAWTLSGLEPERETLLVYEKADHLALYQPLVTPRFSGWIRGAYITPAQGTTEVFNAKRVAAGQAELPPSTGLGSLVFSALIGSGPSLDRSVHVRIEPGYGIAPMYLLGNTGDVTTEIEEGQSVSWGIFLNVPPRDDYEITYTMDDGECVFYQNDLGGWPVGDRRPNVTRVPVRADSVTNIVAPTCIRHDAPPPRK